MVAPVKILKTLRGTSFVKQLHYSLLTVDVLFACMLLVGCMFSCVRSTLAGCCFVTLCRVKEKTRDLAHSRRKKENDTFTDIAQSLPIQENAKDLDKASILRVAIHYLKLRDMIREGGDEVELTEEQLQNVLNGGPGGPLGDLLSPEQMQAAYAAAQAASATPDVGSPSSSSQTSGEFGFSLDNAVGHAVRDRLGN